MCQYVETACFMANVVSAVPGRQTYTLLELGRARVRVEAALKEEDMVIEWTRSAFLSTMFYYRDFYSKRDETVSISPKARKLLKKRFVSEEFNIGMNGAVQKKMRASIRAAIGAGG